MCHDARAFTLSLTKQYSLIRPDIFWMAHETKEYRRLFVRSDFFASHDAFDDGRLPNVANVNGGLKAFVDRCRMEQNRNFRLEE